MTKKHYKLIAEALRVQNHYPKEDVSIRELTDNLATILKMDNPRFDRDKFLDACGF